MGNEKQLAQKYCENKSGIMKTIEELASSKTSNPMTDREKAICILSTLKSDSEEAARLCNDLGISKEVAVQAVLDIYGLAKEVRGVIIHASE